MRFELSQTIRAPVDDVAAAYASVELYETSSGTAKLSRPEVLDRSPSPSGSSVITLRLRYRFTGSLSPAVTAVVDPARLTWVETSVHDLDRHTVAVTLAPDHYADRLKASGSYRYVARGDGTTRHIAGELRVRALLVASAVEAAIVSGLREHLEAEGPQVEAYLAR